MRWNCNWRRTHSIRGLNDDPDNQTHYCCRESTFTDDQNPHSVTKTQVGLENVEDGAQINIIEKS